MEWEERIPQCFGSTDYIFGNHSFARIRAAEMLVELVKADVPWPHLETAVRNFLEERGKNKPQEAIQAHITDQISIMKQYYEMWLLE
ncbi:MAG: hypothetical protein ACOYOS_12925 [Syntrophales bacterium]